MGGVVMHVILGAAEAMSGGFGVSARLAIPLIVSGALMLLLFAVGKVPLNYNLRNLAVRWKTTLMTALAFTLVVALMTVMLAFVNGMYQLTLNSGQPGNVIVLADGATDESFSSLSVVDTADVDRQPGVLRNAGGAPLSSPEVFVVLNQPVAVPEGEKPRRRFVQLRGIEDPVIAATVHGLELLPGSAWFSQAGVQAASGNGDDGAAAAPDGAADAGSARSGPARGSAGQPLIQAVIGEGLAGELGRDRPGRQPLRVGDTFPLGPREWAVVGILKSAGSTFDSEVWAKRSIVGPLAGKQTYSTIVLRSRDAAGAKALAESLKSYRKAALNPLVETEYFARLGENCKQFLYAIIFLAGMMAVGGVFGVMNTMFAAISQRTKDIGVLRILGFRRTQILVSFLLESLVIALIGGLIGCAVGTLADGWTARSTISSGQGGKSVVLQLVVDADILAAGLLLSLVMGGLGGLLPALSAMRLRALESLR